MTQASRGRRVVYRLILLFGIGGATIGAAEILLRVFFSDRLGETTEFDPRFGEAQFFRRSDSLGWDHRPNYHGIYSNGAFRGDVHLDARGNRRNSPAGTFESGYRSIFFLGDSTTASFEVNDDETVPALLERILRQRGLRVNVINLGVRGYGTDQSVRRALDLSPAIPPSDIIYMYVQNDVYDNNVLKNAGREYGKGVYWRAEGQSEFVPTRYPVPEYEADFAGLVILDPECRPEIHTTRWRPEPRRFDTLRRLLDRYLYTCRAAGWIRHAFQDPESGTIDPYRMVHHDGIAWSDGFHSAYGDGGDTRIRCREYFDAQMEFLLSRLRAIPTLQTIRVVQFPEEIPVAGPEPGSGRASAACFRRLAERRVVDGILDLSESLASERLRLSDLECPQDRHFCLRGNRWIAERIAVGLDFGTPGAAPGAGSAAVPQTSGREADSRR